MIISSKRLLASGSVWLLVSLKDVMVELDEILPLFIRFFNRLAVCRCILDRGNILEQANLSFSRGVRIKSMRKSEMERIRPSINI